MRLDDAHTTVVLGKSHFVYTYHCSTPKAAFEYAYHCSARKVAFYI